MESIWDMCWTPLALASDMNEFIESLETFRVTLISLLHVIASSFVLEGSFFKTITCYCFVLFFTPGLNYTCHKGQKPDIIIR